MAVVGSIEELIGRQRRCWKPGRACSATEPTVRRGRKDTEATPRAPRWPSGRGVVEAAVIPSRLEGGLWPMGESLCAKLGLAKEVQQRCKKSPGIQCISPSSKPQDGKCQDAEQIDPNHVVDMSSPTAQPLLRTPTPAQRLQTSTKTRQRPGSATSNRSASTARSTSTATRPGSAMPSSRTVSTATTRPTQIAVGADDGAPPDIDDASVQQRIQELPTNFGSSCEQLWAARLRGTSASDSGRRRPHSAHAGRQGSRGARCQAHWRAEARVACATWDCSTACPAKFDGFRGIFVPEEHPRSTWEPLSQGFAQATAHVPQQKGTS